MTTKQKIAAALLSAVATASTFLLFVEKHEGFGPYTTINGVRYYKAYPDPGLGTKLMTACSGHTKGVKQGDLFTKQQCVKFLDEDIQWAKKRVSSCLNAKVTQEQYNALVSFEFNTGLFCSTQMRRYIEQGNCRAAANEFNNSPQIDKATGKPKILNGKVVMKFTTAGGKVFRGLEIRRAEERKMFERGCD